jgi:glutamate dehydrogenase (NAD(P)+)
MTHPRRRAGDRVPAPVSNRRVVFEELGIDRDPSSLLHDSIEHLLGAAGLVGVRHRHQLILSQPRSEVAVSFPVLMDDGRHRLFRGWRVQHNDALGPYKGGLRFHPSVDAESMRALSLLMTLKCSLLRLPFGGAYGGVACSARELTRGELERVTRRFAWAISEQVGPDRDVVGPGVGTDPQIMSWFADTFAQTASVHARADAHRVATGKPLEAGGIAGRDQAGGAGLVEVLREMLPDLGIDPAHMTFTVAGFGRVGRSTAQALHGAGARLVGVLDRSGAVASMRGLDPDDLVDHLDANDSVEGFRGGEVVASGDFWRIPCDVLVPAALEQMVTATVASEVGARAVAEIGSAPVTPDADAVFLQRGIDVLPGILCNAGGVAVSYFEWLQNRSSMAWTATQVRESLAETMVAAARRVKLARHRYECDWRTAASCAALEQLSRVYELRGIWP